MCNSQCGRVIRKEDCHILQIAVMFEVEGQRKKKGRQ